ncbi:unnamed protein product [Pylaiella littoralis]
MRMISRRERVTADDVKSVQRRPNVEVTKSTLVIPDVPRSPIVMWGYYNRGGGSEAIKSCLRWPSSSDARCHNCAHFFDGVPVPLPVSRDDLRKVYFCEGTFCSWQCAKSFNMRETSPAGRGNRNMYIALLAYKTWIKLVHADDADDGTRESLQTYCRHRLHPALPRSNLVEFGGHMSIEEYRTGFCGIVPPADVKNEIGPRPSPGITAVQSIVDADPCPAPRAPPKGLGAGARGRRSAGMRRIESKRDEVLNNDFCTRLKKARLDPALMVRKKEADVSNTLVFSMGIEIKKRSRV